LKPPIAVLLLPAAVEAMQAREEIEALLRWPGVVALEPGRLPPVLPDRVLRGQARRLLKRLPGRPAVFVVFDAAQRPLADELQRRAEGSVVWEEPGPAPLRERLPARGIDPPA
jgi:hypothetical protein